MYDGIWFITVGILEIILGFPLFLKKIPPNRIYGFRTRALRNNTNLWYKINRICGKYLILSGILLVILNIILLIAIDDISPEIKRIVAILFMLFSLIAITIRCIILSNIENNNFSERKS